MGQWGPTSVSGEGHAYLDSGSGVDVSDLEWVVTAISPKVRTIGADRPIGYWHAGAFGLGASPGDAGDHDWRIDETYWVRYDHEDVFRVINGRGFYSTTIYWRLIVGVTLDLTVYW